jgi:hypothetical protein
MGTVFGSQRKGPKEFGPVFGLFVFVPLLAIATLVSLPFTPILASWEGRKRRLLTEAMKQKNRVMQWPDFIRALKEKRGTLIVEGDPRKAPNFCWTGEDVRSFTPHPCSCDLGSLFDRSYKPFRAWCYERYTSPATGRALLVLGGEGQRRGFALGSEEDEVRTATFQGMPTVLTSSRPR